MTSKFVALAVAALCTLQSSGAEQLVVGPNVNVSKRAGYEAEVSVVVNPTNPQKVFVLSNTAGGALFGGVSSDGGATWTTRLVATGSDGITAAGSHPSAAFDSFGNLFIAYSNATSTAVIVARSVDSGTTFVPGTTFTATVDHPRLTTGPGSVWVAYQSGTNVVARGAAVTALGTVGAFSAEQIAPTSTNGSFADVVAGPGGKVAVGYQIATAAEGPSTVYAHVDTDGVGVGGFGARRTVATTNVGNVDHVAAQPGHGANAAVGLAWDRTGGIHNNRLYMVYTEEAQNESDDFDVFLRYSDNDGATWSPPVLVNEEVANTQMLPKIALDPVTGSVAVVWLDAQSDPANKAVELWGSASIDGGQTFLPNVKISEGASIGTAATIGNAGEFGDYVGLTFYDNVLYAGWADSSNVTGNNPDGTAGLDLYVAKAALTNPDVLTLSTASGLNSNGLKGGPFTPASITYILTNSDAASLNWTATKTQSWVSLSASSGTLAAGAGTPVTVSFNAAAALLAPGTYADTVTFTNTSSGVSQTRPVRLVVSDPLTVSPATSFASSGALGGLFTPGSQSYTLTNTGSIPITWSAVKNEAWVTLSASGATLAPGASTTVTASIAAAVAAALAPGAYTDSIAFKNVTSSFTLLRSVVLTVNPPPPDNFTELFSDTRPNDTANKSWLFTPDTSNSAYSVVRTTAAAFPTDPTGGATLTLTDDSSVSVTLTGTPRVKLYGVTYSSFFVGSNGYVTFGSGDSAYSEDLANHFRLPRIAAFFNDLNPTDGGTISWKQFADRAVVTFQSVRQYSSPNTVTFQIEMFFDGRLRITVLGIVATDGLIGLSPGAGVPAGFVTSDFSNYPLGVATLAVTPAGGFVASGDFGSAISPSSATYTLTNSGNLPMNWTASKTATWLTLSILGGTLAPGETTSLTATISAAGLEPGSYTDAITFTNSTSGSGNATRAVSLTVVLPAPTLNAEPAVTGGTVNTVSWLPSTGATSYDVQRATLADFSDAVTGVVLGVSTFNFAGLSDGTLYRYRVRARRSQPGGNGTWTQTTQGDFDNGVKSAVITTAGGDVTLATAPGLLLTGLISNPSFEAGSFTGWTPTTNSTGLSSRAINDTVFFPIPTAGTYYAGFNTAHNTVRSVGEYVRITQNVDLTNVAALLFDAVLGVSAGSTWSGSVRAELRVDGAALWSSTTAGEKRDQNIDLAGYTGMHTIELREEVIVSGAFNAQWVCFDNIRATGLGYVTSGNFISPAVSPGAIYRWGAVSFARNITAAGTALTVDVLATDGAVLATNVSSGTNLSSLPAVASQPAIKLRANLSSTSTTSTPRLSDWVVNYQLAAAQDVQSQWSAVATSLQDASGPVFAVQPFVTAISGISGTAADPSGVVGVTLNGGSVATSDAFAHWTATSAGLAPGLNVVSISATDSAVPPNTTTRTANVFLWSGGGDGDGDGLPDAWEVANGLNATTGAGDHGALGDLDHDGVSNLLEYAFGQRANAADSDGLPVVSVAVNPADGAKYLLLKQRRRLGPAALIYELEISHDLQTWTSAGAGDFEQAAPPSANVDGITETVTLRIKPSLATPGNLATHVRIRVRAP